MSEAPTLILAFLAGVSLGTIFFGGLWWTIKRAVASARPAAWFFGSLLLRTVVAVSGLYLVSGGDWRRLLACLLGFLLARILAMRLARAPLEKRSRIAEGGAP
jgi:F1F0 ATPase subunit 2